jgi:hypothetical protein
MSTFPTDRLADILKIVDDLVKRHRSDFEFDNNPVDASDLADYPDARKWKVFAERKANISAAGDDMSVKIFLRIKKHDKQAPRGLDVGNSREALLASLHQITAQKYRCYKGLWSASTEFQTTCVGGDRAPQLREERKYDVEAMIEVKFLTKLVCL